MNGTVLIRPGFFFLLLRNRMIAGQASNQNKK